MRRILAQETDAERRLDTVLEERRRELEEQAARLAESVEDIERREQLLRDSRASLERLLRLGTTDLDSREAELLRLLQDVTAREERVRAEEAELARRREELGAVELKRAAIERRERALDERESALAKQEDPPRLAFVPGTSYGLRELEETTLTVGATVAIDGAEYVVARVGPSPLPRDARRCAYLVGEPQNAS